MCNYLVEEVLNVDMFYFVGMYYKSFGGVGVELIVIMELLKNISVLIKNFRDKRLIVDFSDDRFK